MQGDFKVQTQDLTKYKSVEKQLHKVGDHSQHNIQLVQYVENHKTQVCPHLGLKLLTLKI